jgi:hypothetical protein
VFLLRGQLVIAYFYAGVSKLNLDWLMDAVPVRWNLVEPHVMAPYEPYLTAAQIALTKSILHSATFAYLVSYAGLVFDLAIGFLLVIRRTRIFGMILMFLFHATNHFLIFDNIDWFPLVGLTTATIFLDPGWPERFWSWIRRPRLAKPDWAWFIPGVILFPFIGGSLGWKLKASTPPQTPSEHLARVTPYFVVGWLVWQTLMPLRHHLIPGDARFTYEGLSFSWRLKADDHRGLAAQLFLKSPKIISRDASGKPQINWSEWHGDKVLYRGVAPGRIDWTNLPEIVAVLEPMIGERVIYNPVAANIRTEAEARRRVNDIWKELYGRQPDALRRTTPVSQSLEAAAESSQTLGYSREATQLNALASRARSLAQTGLDPAARAKLTGDLRSSLSEMMGRTNMAESLDQSLSRIDPFALHGEVQSSLPFLVIEDAGLVKHDHRRSGHISRAAWKHGTSTLSPHSPQRGDSSGEPLIIYTAPLAAAGKDLLPLACIFDVQERLDRTPYIWWNCSKDLSASKLNHISNQAFYLRRYARRVASLWEREYGHRPSVYALTEVSLNCRPYQLLVDPNADLANVPVTLFGHNPWIKDLETPRIPREAVATGEVSGP